MQGHQQLFWTGTASFVPCRLDNIMSYEGKYVHTRSGASVWVHAVFLDASIIYTHIKLVSRGQTLFRTEGKGLGFGHRATCHPGI